MFNKMNLIVNHKVVKLVDNDSQQTYDLYVSLVSENKVLNTKQAIKMKSMPKSVESLGMMMQLATEIIVGKFWACEIVSLDKASDFDTDSTVTALDMFKPVLQINPKTVNEPNNNNNLGFFDKGFFDKQI
jgi:hypothetical protein